MKSIYVGELNQLMLGLMKRDIEFTFTPFMNGGKVDVPSQNWDAICHDGSYGHEVGELEVMGSINTNPLDSVEGWLSAEEILKRVDKIKGD